MGDRDTIFVQGDLFEPRTAFVSAEAALDALAVARARLVRAGYEVAVQLARTRETIQAQDVWAEMDRRGLLSEADKELPGNWLGVVFKGKEFKHSWEHVGYAKVGNAERNVHAAPRSLWRLRA